jgi:CMP-N,N'-diacetyllegionaminic acid synthase
VKILGIIPAKAGSHKNWRTLGGKTLVEHALHQAGGARLLHDIVLCIDDPSVLPGEVEAITLRGGDIAYLWNRPGHSERLAIHPGPYEMPIDMIGAALDSASTGDEYDGIAYIQPTSPLRTSADIDAVIQMLDGEYTDSVISVTQIDDHHPGHMYWAEAGLPIHPPSEWGPRQGLTKVYYRNGAVYAASIEVIRKGTLRGDWCKFYVMPRERSVNIDDEFDFRMAEWLIGNAQP